MLLIKPEFTPVKHDVREAKMQINYHIYDKLIQFLISFIYFRKNFHVFNSYM